MGCYCCCLKNLSKVCNAPQNNMPASLTALAQGKALGYGVMVPGGSALSPGPFGGSSCTKPWNAEAADHFFTLPDGILHMISVTKC